MPSVVEVGEYVGAEFEAQRDIRLAIVPFMGYAAFEALGELDEGEAVSLHEAIQGDEDLKTKLQENEDLTYTFDDNASVEDIVTVGLELGKTIVKALGLPGLRVVELGQQARQWLVLSDEPQSQTALERDVARTLARFAQMYPDEPSSSK